MVRLNRQEAQARTREHLLVTATEHFLDRGFAAASLEQIADEAGYSKGAVYSNFRNKDALCLVVLDRIRLTKLAHLMAVLDLAGPLDSTLDAFRDWADKTIGDRRWTLLEIEFSARSRQSELLREQIAEGAARMRLVIAGFIRSMAEQHDLTPTMTPEAAATMILSTGIGLGLQRAISPELPVDAAVDAVRTILSSPQMIDTPTETTA